MILTVPMVGRSFPELSFEAASLRPLLFHPRGSRLPLSQDPTPLSDRQARPRPPLAVGSEQRAGLVDAVAGKQQPLDVLAVLGPQLDLEEVAPVGDQGIVGLVAEEIVGPSRRPAQPASLNGSLLRSKRDRKIAASIGSSKQ
jgi:hypothetical protein